MMLNCDGQATALSAEVMGHFRSLVRNASDNGWVHTLAAEVDCMRAQYAIWASLSPPTLPERIFDLLLTMNLLTQARHYAASCTWWRRRSFTLATVLNMLARPGRLPAWERAKAPGPARAFYALPPDASFKDVVRRMMADEASARAINHQLAGLAPGRPTDARAAAPLRAAPLEIAATGEPVFEATGVPLVDELMGMRSLDAAAQLSLQRAVLVAVGALAGTLLLRAIDRYFGRRIEKKGSNFNALTAAVASAFRPCQVLLPYWAGAYILTLGSALAQVAAVEMKKADFAALCRGHSSEVLGALKVFTQFAQDTGELVLIIFAAWALVDFKNRLLHWVATNLLMASESETSAALTLLRPLSGVLNCLIALGAAATALGAYGINLGPIIASVGGLGVVVGLASQRLLMNAASAIALYSARPFVVGDEVHLLAGGAPAVMGTVVQIEPMRTIIHSEDGGLVYVQNADVQNYIIKNMTQGKALQAASAANTSPSEAAEMAAELLE
ncbi:mechanosensitive ion channel [Chlorella sorokiniana]|uniref:Ubiquinol oxidase n=1 Tax=Chlorella sorokiniana TaxID=3076 RepID=A0A2P6TRQ4_CHLSO|nr:mechanosensitive ion channel [Chlorella sorokiniana]|eukprot:PRW56732.1 mechanosensitive ion channel [Chlorella sorokiniana]